MSIADTVQEIIDGEEIDRSTPAEVIAGINAAMQEIEHLRELTQLQAATIFDLYDRVERMLELGRSMQATGERNVVQAVEIITQGGSHNERNQAVITVINRLMHFISGQKWQLARLEEVAMPPEARKRHDNDEIPF